MKIPEKKSKNRKKEKQENKKRRQKRSREAIAGLAIRKEKKLIEGLKAINSESSNTKKGRRLK